VPDTLPHPDVIVTRDGSRTLVSPADGEAYKSRAGALTEARQVYLEGSGVGARLRAGRSTRVLEVGFGTGLNFLVTASLAAEHGAPLDYVAVELRPPPLERLAALGYERLLAPSPVPAALLAWRRTLGDPPAPGAHRFAHAPCRLTLLVADALARPFEGTFDAVYHDAFSPRANPPLWAAPFLHGLAARLEPGGRLVSFTVAGAVRRALTAAGLDARKVPGPEGGKREVLVAERPA